MSDFTGFRRRTDVAADRVRLEQWLRERRIDAALAAAPVEPATAHDTAQYAHDQATPFQDLPVFMGGTCRVDDGACGSS